MPKTGRPQALAVLLAGLLTACGTTSETASNAGPPMPSAAELARGAEQRGDWESAARHWQGLANATPSDREARLALVRALRLANSCGRAVPYLDQLRAETPGDLTVLLESGKCHLISGRLDAAATTLREAAAKHPDSWEAHTVLATVLDHEEKHREASSHHDRAAELAPTNPLVLSNQAISLALEGRLDTALELMRTAATQPNAPSRVRMNLAFLEAVAGNADVAVMMARQEAQGQPMSDSIKLLEKLAAAAGKQGR